LPSRVATKARKLGRSPRYAYHGGVVEKQASDFEGEVITRQVVPFCEPLAWQS